MKNLISKIIFLLKFILNYIIFALTRLPTALILRNNKIIKTLKRFALFSFLSHKLYILSATFFFFFFYLSIIYTLFVCLFVCPIITYGPLDRFASNFDWETGDEFNEIKELKFEILNTPSC